MKKTRIALSVGLLAFVCIAWVMQINSLITENHTYKDKLEAAVSVQEKGLYQKAIILFEELLSEKENMDVRMMWLDTYRLAFADGVVSGDEYEDAVLKMCHLFPGDAAYWEEIMQHYMNEGNYNAARSLYKKCIAENVVSENLTTLLQDIRYAFKIKSKTYTEFTRSPTGYYAAYDGNKWSALDPTGSMISEEYYTYIGPFNAEQEWLCVSDKRQCIYNADGVIESIITNDVIQTGAHGNGMIPFKVKDKQWRFLDGSTDTFCSGIFEAVSNCQNGIAAVFSNGKWVLADTKMYLINDLQFEDIKLHSNMDYFFENIMIASANGSYGIYDNQGNLKNEFSCKDADVYMGEYIAFLDINGKWGYVDIDGNIVIEPRFEKAKSFSGDLAAIQLNGKWGFIDTKGEVVIEPQFLDADYFNDSGACMVSLEDGEYHFLQLKYFE